MISFKNMVLIIVFIKEVMDYIKYFLFLILDLISVHVAYSTGSVPISTPVGLELLD